MDSKSVIHVYFMIAVKLSVERLVENYTIYKWKKFAKQTNMFLVNENITQRKVILNKSVPNGMASCQFVVFL